jgi:hypothetical protein
MQKYDRNKIRKERSGPGSRPPIHNQKRPFNPQRYGKIWNTIHYDLRYGNQTPVGDATAPTMGWICIDGKKHEVTWTEANKLIDTLNDMQNVYAKAKRMGIINDVAHKIERSGVY